MTDDLEALMTGLKGGITSSEAALLRRLAADVESGCIVEVGSYRGKSAVALALGARANTRGKHPAIYCIEPHRPFTGVYGGQFGPDDRGAFYETMVRTQAFREVALVNLSSEDVAPHWNEPVALAFIDGDHRYAGVQRDFECWDRHVVPGGLVAFDDAIDPACGPAHLIAQILETRRYRHVETVGKIVVLRKTHVDVPAVPTRPLRVLVACERIVLSGGLLRMDRIARALVPWGHHFAFLALDDGAPVRERETDLPVLDWNAAAAAQWDAVMVPGAGFSDTTIARLADLRSPNFGVRVQHVLNDRTRRERFQHVNATLVPDVVVFNNLDWPAGTFADFHGRRFHILLGAVDTEAFRPTAYRSHPLRPHEWIVGGQATKNPEPLIEALRLLGAGVTLRLFGHDHLGLAPRHADLVAAGRLQLVGALDEDALPSFYRGVDCVAMVERNAGWANLAAEAAASGVPLICTPHGTAAFARHEDTALVVAEPDAAELAGAIARLRADASLCVYLAERAREAIAAFSWRDYSRELLRLIARNDTFHYLHAPELGLFGKWPVSDRLAGLDPLLAVASGCSVIDFGSAEGVVALEFLRRGAHLLHGFEREPSRVGIASAICADYDGAAFREADLDDFDAFRAANADLLRDGYDIVLYLGIHHHVAAPARQATFDHAVGLARRWFALRTPAASAAADRLDERLAAAGFRRIPAPAGAALSGNLGELALYQRRTQESGACESRAD